MVVTPYGLRGGLPTFLEETLCFLDRSRLRPHSIPRIVKDTCYLPTMTCLSPQVYADRYMRLWDVHTGALVTEVFTGHRIGETVLGLAVDSSDQRIATADSAGFVKVCDGGRGEKTFGGHW